MLKYITASVTFAEIPDEITLCINITGCPNHCEGCHSKFLWKDVGTELTPSIVEIMLKHNKGISCICFMGGDQEPETINVLAECIPEDIKVAWYSGKEGIPECINLFSFDYIKLGPYIEEYGGLDNPNTNQKLFRIDHEYGKNFLVDITSKFWKK